MKVSKRMGPDEWGAHNEARTHQALKKKTKGTPKWFLDFQLVTDEFDVLGVDGRAKIKKKGYWKPMSVPVQTKSSEAGKEEYFRRHPDAKAAKVPVLIPTHDMSPDQIRAQAYQLLEPIYLHYRRDHFKSYFDNLGAKKHAARKHRNFKRIKEKRAARELRLQKPQRPKKTKR